MEGINQLEVSTEKTSCGLQLETEWYECPVCGDAGFRDSLIRFGHACCRNYINELENGGIEPWR